ncbi:OmpP1/FadL family transporter [Gynurincola endophyticus]|jgi:hypothetical protein|uniref:OmpP1/FadL family transporter n=1 Tax=Gynurincola endophyticus TaxID=2479004 RepID=UPI000F8CEEB6|nr:hypothetical protein [Gynurincola endophyticus]
MKRIILTGILGFCSVGVWAQLPEDVLNIHWYPKGGTARSLGFGNAMNALGGDISTINHNPAGLGFYKTNELSITPSLNFASGKADFRGSSATADAKNSFNFSTIGVAITNNNYYSKWSSKVFGFSVSRIADFNSRTFYQGKNNYSSFSEPLANEFFDFFVAQRDQNPNLTNEQIIDNALNSRNLSLKTRMGIYTYLLDLEDDGNTTTVISRAEQAVDLIQSNYIETSGGINEISLGYGWNMNDRIYFGGSIGAPILNYNRKTIYREQDEFGSGNNSFDYTEYTENFSVKGMGINAKLGLIIKPATNLRIGATVHTPTIYGLKEQSSSYMVTNIDLDESTGKDFTVSSTTFTDDVVPTYNYDYNTPWKFGFGAAYFISENHDVTKQRGFITADVEFINYAKSKFKSLDQYDNNYFNQVNGVVRDIYRNAMNVRVGGELKFTDFLVRAGYGYYSNPNRDSELKANIQNISGGLGYRKSGIFIDLAYVHSIRTNVNFPYLLDAPRLNTYADTKNTLGSVVATVGFKF